MERLDSFRWRKSTRSGSNGGGCVEVGQAPGAVLVRDSRDPGGPRLAFGRAAWRRFAGQVKAGARSV
jgi:hypothetical protein